MAGTRESEITAVAAAAAAASTATATTTNKMMMIITTTATTMMLLLFFVWFMLLGVANAPCQTPLGTPLEELLGRLDGLLDRLDTIASNVQPPLPVPLMGAAVLFVFCTTVPARFAAAWSRLVRWAEPVVNPPVTAAAAAAAAAHSRNWIAMWISHLVVWVDGSEMMSGTGDGIAVTFPRPSGLKLLPPAARRFALGCARHP
ncbi:hypothetical protein QBC46DRAFT_439973 [Diplogelasinospora grovesii]|uniref:Uncharacterized protein n=1 Tax=Diplogelasinospora grovesii TaxID=303347 RepID=A0AAN6N6D2_9PEZI|nr:hypothetical protein QBC46DRAFT_439973 [Diplogelasinospora grovesii]